jgi:small subunit ribosomal protein S15
MTSIDWRDYGVYTRTHTDIYPFDAYTMARHYSKAKGKASSKKPAVQTVPTWLDKKPAEVEQLIVQLAKDRHSAAQIGLILRDSYGIPSVKVLCKKTITTILGEHKITKTIPQDMVDAIAKAIKVQKHLEQNNQDIAARRGLILALAHINKLAKYYKRIQRIPLDWKFDAQKAGMYLE